MQFLEHDILFWIILKFLKFTQYVVPTETSETEQVEVFDLIIFA